MSNTVKVTPEEILFIQEHAPKAFARMIVEALEARGKTYDRVRVHKDISSIKGSYSEDIISTARRLLREIKGVEFQPK